MKHFTLLVLMSTLVAASSLAVAAEPDELIKLVDVALAQNPQLDALEQQVAALKHKTTRAGAWKDPKLSVAYQNVPIDSLSLGEEAMSMVNFRLEQTVPFFGKTEKRERVVRQERDSKRWELLERKSQLRALVKRAYYKLALARQLKKLTVDHVDLVGQLVASVRSKYETGRAEQHSLLRLQTLNGRLRDELEDFERQDKEIVALLNAVLHRAAQTPIATPDKLVIPIPTTTVSGLYEEAIQARPLLKQIAADARMHRLAAALARAEAVPDPTFFVAYGLRNELPNGMAGRDLLTFGISVPLPLFYDGNYGARARESLSRARASGYRKDAMSDNIRGQLGDALAAWSRAASKVATYEKTLVPRARQTLDSVRSSYRVDRADFLSLFEAEVELLRFEQTIRVAAAAGLVARATVEELVGKELP